MNLYTKINPWVDASTRYRLAKLNPEGLGTAQVESLSSYVIRLATAHWVSPTNLYKALSVEVHGGTPTTLSSISRIDGYTKLSRHVSDTLNALSSLDIDFRRLTLNVWSAVFATHGCGLLREGLAWCPDCYADDHAAERPRYNRLLWSIRKVAQCPVHRRPFVEECKVCGSSQAMLTASAHIGYCQRCSADLCETAPNADLAQPLSEEQKWKSDACTELLAALQSNIPFERETFLIRFSEFLKRYRGSPKRMARSLNLRVDSIRSWVRRGHQPEIRLFLEVCYRVDIPPLQFFLKSGSLPLNRPRVVKKIDGKKAPALTKAEIEKARKSIQRILCSGHDIQKLDDVASAAGITTRKLQYHLPKEHSQVVQRIFERRAREKRNRDAERVQRVKKRAYSLARRGIYPSQRKLGRCREVLGSDMRNPFVVTALRDIQDQFLVEHPEFRKDSNFMHHLRLSRRSRPSRKDVADHLRRRTSEGRLR